MVWGSGGSKSRLAKAAGAEPAGQMRDEKCTPLWREAHFQVKMYKHLSVGRLLEVVMSKKCTPLWREAHLEVKRLKTQGVRTTFGNSDLEKVHAVVARRTFRNKNVQNTRGSDHFWRLRCRFASLHYTTTLHYTTLHSTTLHYIALHYTRQHYNYNYTTALHYTPLHSTTLNYITLYYTTLHYTPLHYTTLHYATLHYTTFHYTSLHYTTLHSTTLQL